MAEKVAIEKLSDHNWALWKYKVGLVLGEKGLSDIVKGDVPENPNKEWLQRDGVAQSVIGLSLEDTQLCHVMGKASASAMWRSLESYHERRSLCGKVYVLRRLMSIRMEDGGNLAEHLSEIALLTNRLLALGEVMSDHWLVAIVLSSLPESYNMLVMSLESRPEDELTLDFVKGRLLDEWRRRCEEATGSTQQKAMVTKVRPRFKCHYCDREGHYRRDCPDLKADQERRQGVEYRREHQPRRTRKQSEFKQKVNKVETFSDEEACFGMFAEEDDAWYLDSGCTSHMTGDVSKLVDVKTHSEHVWLADGKGVTAQGIGTAKMNAVNRDGKLPA